MPENPLTIPAAPARRWLTGDLLWLGVLLPAVVVVLDQYLVRMCKAGPNEYLMIALTFAVFIIQIGILSSLVGARVKARPYWWGVFAWSVLLVNLQVFALAALHDTWLNPVKAFGLAFGSAQIGTIVCWGLLGKMKWTTRIPFATSMFVLGWVFCLFLDERGNWMPILFLQCVATVLVGLGLRFMRFAIDDHDAALFPDVGRESQRLQFSIRHLFYWTTGVAILTGAGRLVGWQGLMDMGNWSSLTVYAPAFTMISVIALWAALGSESWIVRLPVLLITLPCVGGLLGLYENSRQSAPWNSRRLLIMPAGVSALERLTFWIIWATLAGMLLAAFVMVFRAGGQRLVRRINVTRVRE